jgi:hypothetical protein
MNRSILIVICDFLLVSLLAFSSADINKAVEEGTAPPVKLDITKAQPESGKDLAAVMRLALDQERKSRDQLLGELTRNRQLSAQQETALNEREKQLQTFQQALQSKEQLATQLQQEQTNLLQRYATSQNAVQTLNTQLQASTAEVTQSKEKLAALEAEIKKQAEQATALQRQVAEMARSNQMVLSEKQQLATQLQVAEVERRHATDQVVKMQEEVKVEREEKAKLAEGVKVLASKSGELAQEVRENRPLAPNTIFNQLATNRVDTKFYSSRPGLLGDAVKRKDTETVLMSKGTNIYALCHIQETPLSLANPGTDWDSLTGTLGRGNTNVPIQSLIFCLQDPRVVVVPVTQAEARQLGCKIYQISADPFKFQDAVLVGAREGYYGECRFQIDLTTPGYVKLDNSFLKGLFGKFNPSRGDLVFSKTGELLGVMANSTYCMMLQNLEGAAQLRFGPDLRDQHTGTMLSQLYGTVTGLPAKLQ